jgi:hypothetical protein
MVSTNTSPGKSGVMNKIAAATDENAAAWAEAHGASLGQRAEIPRSKFTLDAGGWIMIVGVLERYSIGTLARSRQNNVSWWYQFKEDIQGDLAPPPKSTPILISPWFGLFPNPSYDPRGIPEA